MSHIPAAAAESKQTSAVTSLDPMHGMESPNAVVDNGGQDGSAVKQNKDAHIVTDKQTPPTEPHDDDIDYPHGVKLALIMAALCLAVFLVALDNTIISTAIPKITDQFNSIKDIGW